MRKRGLNQYKKHSLQLISIVYGKEKIQFNLSQELKVNEDELNDELKKQPGYYGFLLLLHKKLLTQWHVLKERRKSTWAKLYLKAKEKNQKGTQRPFTEEMAKAWADSHSDYQKLTSQCIQAKDDADVIFSAVKGYEQKKDILQTLSSNTRKQF